MNLVEYNIAPALVSTDITVAMSVYKNDKLQHFRIALDSILNQTIPPTEIILVVDGPISDELTSIIMEYKSLCQSLKPIFLAKNGGLGNALRIAVEASSCEFIARMDSDDISLSDRFEKQLEHFKLDKKLSIVGGNICEFVDVETNIVGKRIVPLDDGAIKQYMKKRCPFNHMTVMFKKSEVVKAGNYKDWFWNEDYYLWLRMYEANCRFANLPDILVNVRVGKETYKRRGGLSYFKSEAALQTYMFDKKIISFQRYVVNLFARFILQVILPNNLRGFVFRKFART